MKEFDLTTMDKVREQLPEIMGEIPGWCDAAKALRMFESVLELQPWRIVELGVFGGRSLVALALAAKFVNHKCQVFGIDTWKTDSNVEFQNRDKKEGVHIDYWASQNLEDFRKECFKACERFGVMDHVSIIREDTVDAAPLFSHIDLLHIDGNHTEWASTRDVLNWVPKVPVGGYIWMDDANWESLKTALKFVEEKAKLVWSAEHDASRLYVKHTK